MKKKVLGGLLLFSAALSGCLISCTDGVGTGFQQNDGTGKISLRADLDASVVSKTSSRAEYNTVGLSDLSIQMISSEGATLGPWNLSEFQNEERRFNVGNYKVEAFYGNISDEGFEKPCFYGCAEQVKVEENLTTGVSITATVQNAAVKVRYTEAFRDYMTSWTAHVKSIAVASDETRPVYVRPGEVAVDVDFVKGNGNGAKMEVKRFTAEAAHLYTLTVDLGTGNGVVDGIVVAIDEEVDEQEVPIDISDEVLNAPAPEVAAAGFDPGEAMSFVSGQKFDDSVGFNIMARGGLKSVTLTTESQWLISRGWPAEIDLIQATSAQQTAMEQLGLKALGLFRNPDKMAVVNLAGVLSGIPFSDANNTHSFTIAVTDALGKKCDPVTLLAEAQKVKLSLANPVLYVGSTTLTVDLAYNGGDPTGVIEIRKATATGGSGALLTTTYEKIGNGLYRATCTGSSLNTEDVIKIFARSKSDASLVSETIEVVPLPLLIIDSSKGINSFAHSAVLPVTMGKDNSNIASAMAATKVMLSTTAARSGNFSQANATVNTADRTLTLTGLQAGATYTVKLVNGDLESPEVVFATEAELQIPNGNLDAESTVSASGSYWKRYDFEGWGTNNHMTTNHDGANYAYCKISGTIPTTDSHSGSAVLLRTVGWGSGNSATGNKGTSGNCKYTDPGLLHLGATRTARPSGYSANDNKTNSCSTGPITTDDLDCGIAFASRPSGVSFWYKYSPKNSADMGLAEVHVYDAAGNELSTSTLLLPAATSYRQMTLPLEYTSAVKAAKLYVKFLSSYSEEYVKRTDANFSGPGFANLSNGTFMGSQLYLDDVELNY